jgi:DNA-binding transcriptional ArsR family regulator
MTTTTTKPRLPEPVSGPMFRRVVALGVERIGGSKRARLLALLAAYSDTNVADPPMQELARRLRLPIAHIDALLDRLERDGLVRITWVGDANRPPGKRGSRPGKRNVYELTLDGRAPEQ